MLFDKNIDRKNTYSFKWEKYKGKDILPMWVADTEFKCAQPIIDAMIQRTEHGLFGYHLPAQYHPANQAIVNWLQEKHDWTIQSDWIVWTPGVVPAFNIACRAYCQPGDKVIVQVPNYPPLLAAAKLNGLDRVDIDSVAVDGRWTLDFEQLERQAADPKCKLFILCNPMNPVGSVLTETELTRIESICTEHQVVLCSDEIHCDLILEENLKHLPAGNFAGLEDNSVTLMAASKTFNIAGLGTSFAIIPSPSLRKRFSAAGQGIVPWANIMGLVATEAAFSQCEDWYQAQITYLRDNRAYLVEQIAKIDGLELLTPEATFLAWIDASGLGVDNPQRYFEDRGIGPSPGIDFGDKNFIRINFGCPKSHLEQLFARLKSV
jgi:cystathionine beta-lyase